MSNVKKHRDIFILFHAYLYRSSLDDTYGAYTSDSEIYNSIFTVAEAQKSDRICSYKEESFRLLSESVIISTFG